MTDRRALIDAELRARMNAEDRLRRTRGASGPYLLVAVLLVVGAFTGGRLSVDPSPVYQEFTVEAPQITAREPQVVVRWRDRIVYRDLEPEFVATAPDGGRDRVVEFCRDSGLALPRTVGGSPTTEVAATPVVPRLVTAGRLRRGWLPYGADRLNLFSIGADGSLSESEFRTRGSLEFVAGQGVEVRGSRWWWAKESVHVGLPLLVGRLSCQF